jgi:protein O-mannosyl-transferase
MRFSTTAAIALAIAIASLAVFGTAAWRAGITNWDDEAHLDNRAARSISKATFTSVVMGHYHPLTMLSFAAQQQTFGRNARSLHFTNVVLHAVTSARCSGDRGRS